MRWESECVPSSHALALCTARETALNITYRALRKAHAHNGHENLRSTTQVCICETLACLAFSMALLRTGGSSATRAQDAQEKLTRSDDHDQFAIMLLNGRELHKKRVLAHVSCMTGPFLRCLCLAMLMKKHSADLCKKLPQGRAPLARNKNSVATLSLSSKTPKRYQD